MPRKLTLKGKSEFIRRMRTAHGESNVSKSTDTATEEKLVPGSPSFFSLPNLYTLSSPILSYNFSSLVFPGVITLEIWSTFPKVDLGKGLVHALDMGLAPFGQGILASQSPETWCGSGETYSITVNLSLGLPTLSP